MGYLKICDAGNAFVFLKFTYLCTSSNGQIIAFGFFFD